MALRYRTAARFTRDLDASRSSGLANFREEFDEHLFAGWAGFTGRLVEKKPPKSVGVPTDYIMKPFEIKIAYKGKPRCTVPFELGHNEIGDAENT